MSQANLLNPKKTFADIASTAPHGKVVVSVSTRSQAIDGANEPTSVFITAVRLALRIFEANFNPAIMMRSPLGKNRKSHRRANAGNDARN